jgi:polysaccharide export outer membrane protein
MTKNHFDRPHLIWRFLVLLLLPLGALAQGSSVAAPAAGAAIPDDYVIGPGDSLQVTVYHNPDLSLTVPVRPDGKVSTPLVADMVAVGKTSSQLAADIAKSLSEYVRAPQVNVIVLVALSVYSQVRIVGQVQRPQALPFRAGLTVLDALLASGGLSEFAAGNRATISRVVNGTQQQIKVKLDRLVNKSDMSQNLALKPGDVIFVPPTRF